MSRHDFEPIGNNSFKCNNCGLICDITDYPESEENQCRSRKTNSDRQGLAGGVDN